MGQKVERDGDDHRPGWPPPAGIADLEQCQRGYFTFCLVGFPNFTTCHFLARRFFVFLGGFPPPARVPASSSCPLVRRGPSFSKGAEV